MKLIIERSVLLSALSHVVRVVERRNTIPILANVLLKAGQDSLSFKATDLDIEVTESAAAKVAAPGSTTVPAATLNDIVKKLPEGSEVLIEAGDDGAVIRAGRSRFKLPILPESDFPDLATGDLSHSFTLPSAEFRSLFGRPQFAISTEETRYYLNGIYLHVLGQGTNRPQLVGVATDGHRLAKIGIDAPAEATGIPGVIVPRKAIAEAMRLSAGVDSVSIKLSSAKIVFEFGGVRLVSKLIDGTFPDYARVIPSGNDKIVEIDREEFSACIERVAIVSSERGRAVRLAWSEGKLEASVTNDSGSANEEVAVDYPGPELVIGFNARYMGDILAAITSEVVVMEMSDPGSPAILRGKGDDSATFICMPLRV